VKLHGKLSGYLWIKTKVLKRLRALKAANSATHSQRDGMEANIVVSSAEMMR